MLRRLSMSLATAAVLALGILAPTASAEDNSGTVAKGETRATTEQCDMYKKWSTEEANAKPPNTKGAEAWKTLAGKRGCKWAQSATAPAPTRPQFEAVHPWAQSTQVYEDLSQDLSVYSP